MRMGFWGSGFIRSFGEFACVTQQLRTALGTGALLRLRVTGGSVLAGHVV